MYKIGLRSGAPVSVGHMMEVTYSVAYAVNKGHVICIVEGMAKHAENTCPDAIVSDMNVKDDEGTVTVMLLTPDMLLEVPVKGTDVQIAGLQNGAYIKYAQDHVDASGTSYFCQIIDTLGAKKAGDKILVRFVEKEDNA
jgi:hypothetical protein